MSSTPRLTMPYLAPNQAQKHVTLNESLRRLDLLVQVVAASRTISDPPDEPEEGDCWIVGDAASGDLAGREGEIAGWQDGAWAFAEPRPGWVAYVLDEDVLAVWKDGTWGSAVAAPSVLQQLTLLRVGTEADAENPFAAKLNKALWTALGVGEGGDGDLRYTLNNEAPENTLSLLMQSGWSGRAEIGLAGNDDLSVKVSADGADWKDALVVDRESGAARFPHGLVHAPSGAALSSLMFTPGGDGAVSLWRMNASHTQNPRTATVSSVAGDVITLTAADAAQFGAWTGYMIGVVMARIWNTSKSPAESAWVMASPSSSSLKVHAAADIVGWLSGETVQIGDPTGTTPGRVIALDISPMLQNLFGAVFRQTGLVVKGSVVGAAGDSLALTADGVSGSFITAARYGAGDGTAIIPCTQLSPVSDSNLVFVREEVAATATTEIVSSIVVVVA